MILPNDLVKELTDQLEKNILKCDSHFNLGPKLHIDRQFFVKRIFEDSKLAEKIAKQLYVQMDSVLDVDDLQNSTLVGFGSFLGIFLNHVVGSFDPSLNINYALVDLYQGQLSFLTEIDPHRAKKIILILPISCRFELFFTIRTFIAEHFKNGNSSPAICDQFFSVFLILDERLKTKFEKQNRLKIGSFPEEVRNIYSLYSWESIEPFKVVLSEREKHVKEYYGHYLLASPAVLQLSDSCNLCFPAADSFSGHVDAILRPLIETTIGSSEIDLILHGLPKFISSDDINNAPSFSSVFRHGGKDRKIHLAGNLVVSGFHYTNYIRRDAFYEVNKDNILRFFEKELEPYLSNLSRHEKIVFIVLGQYKISRFLEDFTKGFLHDRNVTIIPYSPSSEYLDNFVNNYSAFFDGVKRVFFFDEIMAGGVQLKKVSDHLKNARIRSNPYSQKTGFDAALALVNRSTVFEKTEIIRKLNQLKVWRHKSRLISFFKLNVPSIDAAYSGNPISTKLDLYTEMLKETRLDALKMRLLSSISKERTVNIQTLEEKNNEEIQHFPFSDTLNEFEFYREKFTESQKNLIKLEVFHYIGEWFARNPKNFSLQALQVMIDDLTVEPKLRSYFIILGNEEVKYRRRAIEKNIIEHLVIKVLTARPFIVYREVSEVVYKYCNVQLKEMTAKMLEIVQKTCKEKAWLFDEDGKSIALFQFFREFKFYIKRSVELNSNYIISFDFIYNLKQMIKPEHGFLFINNQKKLEIEQKKPSNYTKRLLLNLEYERRQIKSFKIFLLRCYKQLTYNSTSKSIVLEGILNHKNLLPDIFSDPEIRIRLALQDPFYHLGRILKVENTLVLSDLQNRFLNRLYDNSESCRQFKEMVFKLSGIEALKIIRSEFLTIGSEPANRTSHLFISKSKHFGLEQADEILNSIAAMLYTSALLKEVNGEYLRKDLNRPEQFMAEIKRILRAAVDIVGPNFEYAFSVEYKAPSGDPDDTSHVYTFLSNDDTSSLILNPHGFVLKMLDGLSDVQNENLQTFILCVRQGNDILSFADEFECFQDSKLEKKEKINVASAFKKDFGELQNPKIFKKQKMVLFFRLANIGTDDQANQKRGRAVLAICSDQDATPLSAGDFVNVEKLRLLVLLKDALLDFMQKQFDHNAFIDLLNTRSALAYQNKLRHGLLNYIDAQSFYFENKESPRMDDMFEIVNDAMMLQLSAPNQSPDTKKKSFLKSEIKRSIEYILEDSYLGNRSILPSQFEVKCYGSDCVTSYPVVVRSILPELLINMKKYSPHWRDAIKLKIEIFDKEVKLVNKWISDEVAQQDININSAIRTGQRMCSDILKGLGLSMNIIQKDENNQYVVTIVFDK